MYARARDILRSASASSNFRSAAKLLEEVRVRVFFSLPPVALIVFIFKYKDTLIKIKVLKNVFKG